LAALLRGGELHGEFPTTVADFPTPTSPLKIGGTARVGNNVGNSEAHDPLMASRAALPLRLFDQRRGRSAHQNSGCTEAEDCGRRRPRLRLLVAPWDGRRSPDRPTRQLIPNPRRWPDLARDGTAGGAALVQNSGFRMLTASVPVRTLATASVRARRRENRQGARSPLMGAAHARGNPDDNVGPLLTGMTGQRPARVRRPIERGHTDCGSWAVSRAALERKPPGWVELRRPCRLWSATGALGRKAGGPMTVTTTNAR
jgi:hypothetical protein